MVVILLMGGTLGWVVNGARVQRDAVAAIRSSGGTVYYNWELNVRNYKYGKTYRVNSKGRPMWPGWLVSRLGPDYFGHVVRVELEWLLF